MSLIRTPACLLLAAPLVVLLSGCGGSGNPGKGGSVPPATADTAVTLVISSTANDQLQAFDLQLESLTLTSKSGKTVDIFSTPPYANLAEFIHLNGFSEPVLTVSVPQDTYTAATATIGTSEFTCVALDQAQDSIYTSTFDYGSTPAAQVSVNVPQTIDVNSVAMGLSLNLQVSPSATYGSCIVNGVPQYSIDPTFDLNPVIFENPNDNVVAVLGTTLRGILSSVDAAGNNFVATTSDGLTLEVSTQSGTTFQNVAGLSALTAGTPVEMDLEIGGGGRMNATRVQLLDAAPANLSLFTGPITAVFSGDQTLYSTTPQEQGYLPSAGSTSGPLVFTYGGAAFQVSSYVQNLAQMPFTPVFSASTMVAGQNVSFTTHATTNQGGPTYLPAATMTLIPQTIDGVVTSIATSGTGTNTMTAYTVALAPYDLFPDLAVQPGQTTLLTAPDIVTVYTLGGAFGVQPAVGAAFRFTGLVFNDNGTLKMDCLQILPGVAL